MVLFRHHWIGIDALQRVGWVGVDLFFVLSGFLVSGLLFSEYKKTGEIKPVRFLIRRGFKIYPLFYLSILFTAFYLLFINPYLNYKGVLIKLLPEVFFIQNYRFGFWAHHWSLAIEEHFYILLSLAIFLLIKYKRLHNIKWLAALIFTGCLGLRILSNIYLPNNENFDETHLRIDSLFAGVVIGFAYHFHPEKLKEFYAKYKIILITCCFIPLSFLFTHPLESVLLKTVGFSLLYISFSSLLLVFLFDVKSLSPFTRPISKIGFYSYSIYLFHLYLPKFVVGETYLHEGEFTLSVWVFVSFLIYFIGSILLGILMSKLVEIPFLKLRDRWFPKT